jgi:hypothetical protein
LSRSREISAAYDDILHISSSFAFMAELKHFGRKYEPTDEVVGSSPIDVRAQFLDNAVFIISALAGAAFT